MQVVRRSWKRGVGAGLIALAVLASCSSSGDDDDSGATDATADGGEQTEEASTGSTTGENGTDAESGSSFGTGHLCELVPEEVVEQVTGISVQVGLDTASECGFNEESSGNAFSVANIALENGGPDQFEFDRTHPIGSSTIEEVAGVGDAAIYDTGFNLLRVLIGDQIVVFSIIDFNVTDKKGAAIELANELIANL
jgi:hypothetical protein